MGRIIVDGACCCDGNLVDICCDRLLPEVLAIELRFNALRDSNPTRICAGPEMTRSDTLTFFDNAIDWVAAGSPGPEEPNPDFKGPGWYGSIVFDCNNNTGWDTFRFYMSCTVEVCPQGSLLPEDKNHCCTGVNETTPVLGNFCLHYETNGGNRIWHDSCRGRVGGVGPERSCAAPPGHDCGPSYQDICEYPLGEGLGVIPPTGACCDLCACDPLFFSQYLVGIQDFNWNAFECCDKPLHEIIAVYPCVTITE